MTLEEALTRLDDLYKQGFVRKGLPVLTKGATMHF